MALCAEEEADQTAQWGSTGKQVGMRTEIMASAWPLVPG